jgi:hypothetical protein
MNDNDEENLLAGRITLEQLLLAANVLSAQNPQGQDFDRRRLLEEAHELAEQAREVAFMTAFNRNYRRSERMRYFVKLGYDRLGELEFVPFEQAAVDHRTREPKTGDQEIREIYEGISGASRALR